MPSGSHCVQLPWLEVKKEMTEEKGLPSDVADKIGEYVKHKGRHPRMHAEFEYLICVILQAAHRYSIY
jgi:hypothetical protein